ncbi:MAG: cytidine deaminase [Candidatus Dormibacteria bacterium]
MSTTSLSAADHQLIAAARAAAAHSYSPYSHFQVGSALRLRAGEVVTGTNVETASYGGTICAERSALTRACTDHGDALSIASLAVVATAPGLASCPPCAICRNMMDELMPRDARVVFLFEGEWVTRTVAELVPFPFQFSTPSSANPSANPSASS